MKNLVFVFLVGWLLVGGCRLEELHENVVSNSTVNFTYDPEDCFAPCVVTFKNRSTNADSFLWDFGDGEVSNLANPEHRYLKPGEYKVELTSTRGTISSTTDQIVTVRSNTFTKTFGGTSIDIGNSVQQTTDGGYIIAGSFRFENVTNIFLIKTDNRGVEIWSKAYEEVGNFGNISIQQTVDGGYVVAGGTSIIHLIKVNKLGDKLWCNSFVPFKGTVNAVQQTMDGGYIITGKIDVEIPAYNVGSIVYLIKTDNEGREIWRKMFNLFEDYNGIDEGNHVQQTEDGGYIITGYTIKDGIEKRKVFIMKTDSEGVEMWRRIMDFSDRKGNGEGNSIQQTEDGGYVITGYIYEDVIKNSDVFLIKFNNEGQEIWRNFFGNNENNGGNSVRQTMDGGYIITGYTRMEATPTANVYLIKIDNTGQGIWERDFGGNDVDIGYSVQQTVDCGYIIVGYTSSEGAGSRDFYLLKTDSEGNIQN